MAKKGEALPQAYGTQNIHYRVCLSSDGAITNIISLGQTEDKKTTYPVKYFSKEPEKPSIKANIMEYRPLYLFGLNCEKGQFTTVDKTNKAQKSHEAFVATANDFYAGIDSPLAKAYLKFVNSFVPSENTENEQLLKTAANYGTSKFDFCLEGSVNDVLEDDPQVKRKWEAEYERRNTEQDAVMAMCPIYGEMLPVAQLHNKIKGIRGGQASGCLLVCFNNPSENSYNKEQSYNSGVSQKAMLKYTEALNYLLKSPAHHATIDTVTLVYFVNKIDEQNYLDFVQMFALDGVAPMQTTDSQEHIEENLDATIKDIAHGSKSDFSYYDTLDKSAKFYIFGLVPNASRVAVKFSYVNTFGNLRKNLEKYHQDFAVGDLTKAPKLQRIIAQLKSPKSNQDLPADITIKLMQSILNGTPFPQIIMQTVVSRIKKDSDDKNNHYIKMNDVRIGLLKACLNRKCKHKEEVITPMLNEQNKNPAYLCGRLFAVLEKIQQDSTENKLDKTIKDAYFASAMSTPATIFSRLIKLSQHHLAKVSDAQRIYYNKLMGSILSDLTAFPNRLDLTEQSNFIIGYYQQNEALYTKKKTTEEI
jgi:CRISPR-associated protein Csd1